MLPVFSLGDFRFSPQIPLLVLYLALCCVLVRSRRRQLGVLFPELVIAAGFALALIGGRAFFLLFESDVSFYDWEWAGFFQSPGRSFYGAIAGVALSIFVLGLFAPSRRREHWNTAALLCALGYGILKLGCFANGCCWGSLTGVPWAVMYDLHDSVMPYHSVPVHPVQLYDSAFGFALFGILMQRERTKSDNWLALLCLLPAGKFFTELFRGDTISRDLKLGLSVGQLTSLSILVCVGILIFFRSKAIRIFTPLT